MCAYCSINIHIYIIHLKNVNYMDAHPHGHTVVLFGESAFSMFPTATQAKHRKDSSNSAQVVLMTSESGTL